MSTLSEFLLARIAEDEAVAKSAPTAHWRIGSMPPAGHYAAAMVRPGVWTEFSNNHSTVVVEVPQGAGGLPGVEAHIARHDPARVLALCAAHRKIVEAHPITDEIVGYGHRTHDFGCVTCHDWDGVTCGLGYCPTLRALASVYADHDDYREEWA